MALQDMVNNVERVGDDLLVVEFNNGLAVGYEKDDRGVAYGIIQRGDMPFEVAKPNDLDTQRKTEYTDRAFRFFFDYGSKKNQELEKEQLVAVEKLVEPLEIQKTKGIDYGTVAQNIGIGLCSPVLFPLGLISTALAGLTGSQTLSTAGMLGSCSPILGFYGLKELVEPSRQWMKLGNQDALASENDGTLPAIVVVKEAFIGKPSVVGKSSDKFPWLDIILPSGHSWFITYGPYYSTDIAFRRSATVDQDAYNSSKHFLKSDLLVQRQLTALIDEEESLGRRAEEFKKELTTEQQGALLNHLGFVKA